MINRKWFVIAKNINEIIRGMRSCLFSFVHRFCAYANGPFSSTWSTPIYIWERLAKWVSLSELCDPFMTSVSLCRRHVSDVIIKLNKFHHNNNVITSPFRFDPRGWEPHFVTTEWRPQGALLTQVGRTQRSPRKVFVTKWQSKLTPSYKMVPRFLLDSHPLASVRSICPLQNGGDWGWLYSHYPRIPRY